MPGYSEPAVKVSPHPFPQHTAMVVKETDWSQWTRGFILGVLVPNHKKLAIPVFQ